VDFSWLLGPKPPITLLDQPSSVEKKVSPVDLEAISTGASWKMVWIPGKILFKKENSKSIPGLSRHLKAHRKFLDFFATAFLPPQLYILHAW